MDSNDQDDPATQAVGNDGEATSKKASRGKRTLAWVAAAILAGLATVIGAYVTDLNEWAKSALFHQAPLTATPTAVNPGNRCDGGDGWVQPTSVSRPPLAEDDASDWAAHAGATPASPVTISVTTQGKSDGVLITAVQLTNVKRIMIKDPAHYLWHDECGGGPVQIVRLGYQLSNHLPTRRDLAPSVASAVSDSSDTAAKGDPFPRVISEASPDKYVLSVYLDGTGGYSFDIKVSWRKDDRAGDIVLDNSGKHYRVAGIKNASNYESKDGSWNSVTPEYVESTSGGASRPTADEQTSAPQKGHFIHWQGFIDYTNKGATSGVVLDRPGEAADLLETNRAFREFLAKEVQELALEHEHDGAGCATPDLTLAHYDPRGYATATYFDCHTPAHKYLLMAKYKGAWEAIWNSADVIQPCSLLRKYRFPAKLFSFDTEGSNDLCENVHGDSVRY